MSRFLLSIAALLLGSPGTAGAQGNPLPLFADDSTLELTIEAPFRQLARNTDDRSELDGVVRYREADGRDVVLDAEIRIRGKSRLELCSFPPLRVDLRRGQLDGTVFAGQNHLKLVTLCNRRDSFRDYLTQEYQIYRAYNALTGHSFRVRWLSVEYIDTEDDRAEPFTEPAFFIEEDWEVAERSGLEVLETAAVDSSELDTRNVALLSLFQYMIANTDWSAITAAPDEEDCCHNSGLIAAEGGRVIVLPYDFDQAGLISTSYAQPNPSLRIRSVRTRLYRGYCVTNTEIDWAVQRFNEQRAAIEDIFDSEAVAERTRERTLEYLADFYEIINDPEELQDEIVDECR